MTVKVKWADFHQATRSRSLPVSVVSLDGLHAVSLELIRSVFPPRKGIRLVGVTLSNFRGNRPTDDGELNLVAA